MDACKINAPFCSAEISTPPVTKLPNIERGRRGSVSQPQSPLANNIDTDAGESVAGKDERFLCKHGDTVVSPNNIERSYHGSVSEPSSSFFRNTAGDAGSAVASTVWPHCCPQSRTHA